MARLRTSNLAGTGYRRVRRGRRFVVLDARDREVTDPEVLARVRALAIPPAWQDVWICPAPDGHIQAVGFDARGRKQYRYHEVWRRRRDRHKFARMLAFARALPDLRAMCNKHLAQPGLGRDRVLACAVRMLDIGLFRPGGAEYARENESFGLATLQRRHMRLGRQGATFDYVGKSGKRRMHVVDDTDVLEVLTSLGTRRTGQAELLAYEDDGRWVDVAAGDLTNYIREHAGPEFSAKDFRTWHATVLAACLVAGAEPDASPKRVAARVCAEVATVLGNTPAVCRTSYIDPRVFELHAAGRTVHLDAESAADLAGAEIRAEAEVAVLDLLDE